MLADPGRRHAVAEGFLQATLDRQARTAGRREAGVHDPVGQLGARDVFSLGPARRWHRGAGSPREGGGRGSSPVLDEVGQHRQEPAVPSARSPVAEDGDDGARAGPPVVARASTLVLLDFDRRHLVSPSTSGLGDVGHHVAVGLQQPVDGRLHRPGPQRVARPTGGAGRAAGAAEPWPATSKVVARTAAASGRAARGRSTSSLTPGTTSGAPWQSAWLGVEGEAGQHDVAGVARVRAASAWAIAMARHLKRRCHRAGRHRHQPARQPAGSDGRRGTGWAWTSARLVAWRAEGVEQVDTCRAGRGCVSATANQGGPNT